MKKKCLQFAKVCLVALTFTACEKGIQENHTGVSAETLSRIESLGFNSENAQKIDEGYLVEGDIILTEKELTNTNTPAGLLIAKEEQYRTNNLVSLTSHPTINIALDNSSAAHDPAFSAALNEAISRYTTVGTEFNMKFQRVDKSQPHQVTIVAYYEASNTLGSAGFPTSTGDPYHQVKMNTYHYSTGTTATNVDYIATIIAHELGHCIGMRHTDYMNRSFSCGGRKQNEEKPFASGYGAIHIPGTPTTADKASWMLACIGGGVNRPFNANDKIALNYLY